MDTLALALLIYASAILISLLVAVLIKGVVAVAEWLRRLSEPAVQSPTARDDIAVIAAAVYAMLGAQRIVHIEDVHRGQVWTASARASQYASRKPSRRHRH
jgi:hypothetical protein